MQVAIESGAIILAPKYDFLGWVPKQSHGRRLGYDGFFAFLLLQQKGWAGTAFGWKAGRRSRERYYYLVSDYARLGKENKGQATSWRYAWFETLFLRFIVRLNWGEVAQEATPLEETITRKRLAIEQTKLHGIQLQLKRLSDLLATTDQEKPRTILDKISSLEKEEAKTEAAVMAIAKEAAVFESRRLVMEESGDKIKSLVATGDYDSRLRLREEIRRKIARIDVYANGVPQNLLNDLPLTAPGWPTFKITFVNGCHRWVFNPSKRPTTDEAALLDTNLPPEEVPGIVEDEEVLDAGEVLKAIKRGEPMPETKAPQVANTSKPHLPKDDRTGNSSQLDMVLKEKSAPYRARLAAGRQDRRKPQIAKRRKAGQPKQNARHTR